MTTPLTPPATFTVEAYIASGGTICPVCGGTDIHIGGLELKTYRESHYQYVKFERDCYCKDESCSTLWTQEHELPITGYGEVFQDPDRVR